MQFISSLRKYARPLSLAALLFASAQALAIDTFDPASFRLSIPALAVGTVQYSNVVVKVGTIVTVPSGTSPNGPEDWYDIMSTQLTVQAVKVGATTYTNAAVTVASVISIGTVSGADTFDGAHLTIPVVQVGPAYYTNVLLTVGLANVVSAAGGMPNALQDIYDAKSGQLAIPAVTYNGRVYTNVTLRVGLQNIQSVGGELPLETVLYSFSGLGGVSSRVDGSGPAGSLVQGTDGNFYGTTVGGGAHGVGTVFKVTPAGVESLLYAFGTGGVTNGNAADGESPWAGLVEGRDGNFYGTAELGGQYGQGTVFRITPAGALTVLHSFGGNGGNGTSQDGAQPLAGLILANDGNFYGTTQFGGSADAGTVFQVTPGGVVTVLYSFTGGGGVAGSMDGWSPQSTLIQGADGNLYGTTLQGGVYNFGTVYRVTLGGAEAVLYSFGAAGSHDGQLPYAALVQGSDGALYGTTESGGLYGEGTAFRMTTSGVVAWSYSFAGQGRQGRTATNPDGAYPYGGLVFGRDGNLYGTTWVGGTYFEGTVFRITPAGAESVLRSFASYLGTSGSNDGGGPFASLIQGSDGNLYGTTQYGGTYNQGTIFSLSKFLPP